MTQIPANEWCRWLVKSRADNRHILPRRRLADRCELVIHRCSSVTSNTNVYFVDFLLGPSLGHICDFSKLCRDNNFNSEKWPLGTTVSKNCAKYVYLSLNRGKNKITNVRTYVIFLCTYVRVIANSVLHLSEIQMGISSLATATWQNSKFQIM